MKEGTGKPERGMLIYEIFMKSVKSPCNVLGTLCNLREAYRDKSLKFFWYYHDRTACGTLPHSSLCQPEYDSKLEGPSLFFQAHHLPVLQVLVDSDFFWFLKYHPFKFSHAGGVLSLPTYPHPPMAALTIYSSRKSTSKPTCKRQNKFIAHWHSRPSHAGSLRLHPSP